VFVERYGVAQAGAGVLAMGVDIKPPRKYPNGSDFVVYSPDGGSFA
jgi:hypothetical protein